MRFDGWHLLAVADMNGTATAIFEKHVTYQGVIAYVTKAEGVIDRIPKKIGNLSKIRPRPINTPHGSGSRADLIMFPAGTKPGNIF